MPNIPSEYNILVIICVVILVLLLVRVAQFFGRRNRDHKAWLKSQNWADQNTERRMHHEKPEPLQTKSNRRVGFRRKRKRRAEKERRETERRFVMDESYSEKDNRLDKRRESERRKKEERRDIKRRDWDKK